ncbi:uncharacterized protein An02g12300 [Aspergillus niger]|uniref:Contig An02c0390, genomic contig n=2 Tax=Aspergillus niger TaxID=5061 RepID=A2QEU7_ASPNC|nr:uncharacterized protein An02g12300 [Aspergillus niger]CAK37911.1 unnamed protein product [Aspergillus niger]
MATVVICSWGDRMLKITVDDDDNTREAIDRIHPQTRLRPGKKPKQSTAHERSDHTQRKKVGHALAQQQSTPSRNAGADDPGPDDLALGMNKCNVTTSGTGLRGVDGQTGKMAVFEGAELERCLCLTLPCSRLIRAVGSFCLVWSVGV